MDLMNAHGFGDLPSWSDIVRDFHCRLAESFFFIREILLFSLWVSVHVFVYD